MNASADIQTHLPLTEVTYFILLSLTPGPRHGYAIMKDVRSLSKGRVVLSTGTLYGALKRLLEGGWILRSDEAQPNGKKRDRKTYLLTELGRHILGAELERLDSLVSAAQLRVANNAP